MADIKALRAITTGSVDTVGNGALKRCRKRQVIHNDNVGMKAGLQVIGVAAPLIPGLILLDLHIKFRIQRVISDIEGVTWPELQGPQQTDTVRVHFAYFNLRAPGNVSRRALTIQVAAADGQVRLPRSPFA